MNEAKNESAAIEGFNDGSLNENNSCRDMTLVTEDQTLQEDIVHISDKKE